MIDLTSERDMVSFWDSEKINASQEKPRVVEASAASRCLQSSYSFATADLCSDEGEGEDFMASFSTYPPYKDGPAFMYFNAGRLFGMAYFNADTIKCKWDSEPARPEALFSVVFAAISMEAFMNELGLASQFKSIPDLPANIVALGALLEEAEESRAQVMHKYQIAKFVLSGKTFDSGTAPYQNAAMLIALRNTLVHARGEATYAIKSGQMVQLDSQIVAKVRRTGAIASDDEICDKWGRQRGTLPEMNWLDAISTKALALWSCKAAASLVIAILDALPPGAFGSFLNGQYRQMFETAFMS